VCSDGAIADATGFMPDSLKLEADQRFFAKGVRRNAGFLHEGVRVRDLCRRAGAANKGAISIADARAAEAIAGRYALSF
jgi:hypothetical protein